VLNYSHQIRQFLLIALMGMVLIGVQIAQASPLHDHTQQHMVDCALCHLQFGDDTAFGQPAELPVTAATAGLQELRLPFYVSSTLSPYQSRAPPRPSF
jgi:hypothetical protein